ncbi:hypothetical protein [Lutibaculum baratangense]|uniref:hypothetical protein n=1 Tax=Lutibaculum baratangense TaxID=1358440 RepID=UPI001268AC46|nr:hypothetical protein [Lutibaculum baratangense]
MDGDVKERLARWLVTTCLFGLLPVIARAFVWTLFNSGVEPIAISDLVAFGLVIHSANIAELSRSGMSDAHRTLLIGISVLFIVLYALLLFTTIASNADINHAALLRTTILLSAGSFILGFFVVACAVPKKQSEFAA